MFAFPYVFYTNQKCQFVVTALGDANVTVTAPAGGLKTTDLIAQGTSKLYTLNCDDMEVSNGTEAKAVILTSDVDVQMEVVIAGYRGEGFLSLPVHPESTEFVTAAYFNPGPYDDYYTMIIAVASQPETTVNIYR